MCVKRSRGVGISLSMVRNQSAMEYLMTYGWAILIIGVVLGGLYGLGVFNGTNFSPRVSAGACQVERLGTQMALVGECQGGLPQYVAHFNGQSSYVSLSSKPFAYPTSGSTSNYQITVSAWFETASNGIILGQDNAVNPPSGAGGWVPAIYLDANGLVRESLFWHGSTTAQVVSGSAYDTGTWHSLVGVYDDGVETVYLDGKSVGSESNGENSYSGSYYYFIGTGYGNSWPSVNEPWFYFNGDIADVQVYNASLSANEVQALYLEGIGGAPIDVRNIVGWWPLNGNPNDYSGNDYNGEASSGVSYTSSYLNGYTTP